MCSLKTWGLIVPELVWNLHPHKIIMTVPKQPHWLLIKCLLFKKVVGSLLKTLVCCIIFLVKITWILQLQHFSRALIYLNTYHIAPRNLPTSYELSFISQKATFWWKNRHLSEISSVLYETTPPPQKKKNSIHFCCTTNILCKFQSTWITFPPEKQNKLVLSGNNLSSTCV